MQLKRPQPIHTALTAVTMALLGTGGRAQAATADKVESSLLIYNETNRVKAAESVTALTGQLDARRSYSLRVTLDGLTGASPNGATPAGRVQTFTGASGNVGFTAQPGRTPLDDSFRDTRIALDGTLADQLDRMTTATYGGHLSLEQDYFSIGANGGLARDFFRKNLTLSLSGAYSHDTVSPRGGAPDALASMPPPSESTGEGEGEGEGEGGAPGKGKHVLDAVAGFTQVLDRSTLLSADYSVGLSAGYLTDPYKLLSVVDAPGGASPGEPVDYRYEKRPTSRLRQALYGELKRYLWGASLDVSYRYYWDDWGITSRTVDVLPHLPLPGGHSLEPHFRWYRQSAADFSREFLIDGQALPQYASADHRLAAFDAITVGAKYSLPLNANDRLSITGEYYRQSGTRGPPDSFGALTRYDLFPPLDVAMVRIGYAHDF